MDRESLWQILAEKIAGLGLDHPVRVGIDGVDGVGKTTAADELAVHIRAMRRSVIRASVDSFHQPQAIRYRRGRQSPEGFYHDSYQLDALQSLLLAPLGEMGSRQYKTAIFDHRMDEPVEQEFKVAPDDAVLVFDGIFLHRKELYGFWDFSILLDAPFDVTVRRCAQREGTSPDPADASNQRYIGGQQRYFQESRPRDAATVVIHYTDFSNPRIVRSKCELGLPDAK